MELHILLITLGRLLIVGLAIDEFGRHWCPRPAWRWYGSGGRGNLQGIFRVQNSYRTRLPD